ncbi:SGNH/GDSL hydrolase family protein [Spirillospora albida]|uniref:SGNH/GDSL hydrolase family protein n=1 Tax=Spirillospora albida TaxID=58123 RepID=UPI0004BFE609|nr:SGNH/GDSL hydrolase family protein [Spirillospora albida]
MLFLLAPILLVQARRMARDTPRLEPASGDEQGVTGGTDPEFTVVVIGESTAVGVGAAEHAEALPGYIAEELAERLHRCVGWAVGGESGASARRVARKIVPALDPPFPDLVVATVGINDLTRMRRLPQWADDVTHLIATLHLRYPRAMVVIAGMPPVHRFPAIPQPLRSVLGARARTMDRITREVARANGAVHVPMDEEMARDRRLFAADGFHPSADGYRAWAKDLAEAVPPRMEYRPAAR